MPSSSSAGSVVGENVSTRFIVMSDECLSYVCNVLDRVTALYRTYYGAIPPELDIDEDVSPPFSPGPVSRPEKSHPACERPPLAKATRPDSSTSGTVGSSRSPWAGYTTPAIHEDEEILIADDEEPVRVGNVGKVPQILISSVERPPLEELSGWRVFLLMIPTVCDIIGTTVSESGLSLSLAAP
jgi:hypothetical protein